MVAAAVLLAAWIGVAIWMLAGREDETGDATSPDGPADPATTFVGSAPSSVVAGEPATTVAPSSDGAVADPVPTAESLIDVSEVWLVGHEDGTADWGATLASLSDVDRGPIRVEATFVDESGAAVFSRSELLSGLPAGGSAVVGGTLNGGEMPTRLQVEVSVGRPLDSPAFDGSGLDVRSLDRRSRPDGTEELSGLLVSSRESDVADLQLALLWRDATGDVSGSVIRDVALLRPGVAAHFTVPLDGRVVPDGLPTELVWAQTTVAD